MTVLDRLASALGRRDEVPNQELAKEIVEKEDHEAVRELVASMTGKSKAMQNDCIKVLYEVGEQNPELIAAYLDQFMALLNHKNNRLQWGAMTALNCIARVNPKDIDKNLGKIMQAVDQGSVITRDYAVNILINLAAIPQYAENAFDLLIVQLRTSPTNQLPMYAERATAIITENNKEIFIATLNSRLDDIEKESKRKRIEKVIRKLSN